MEITTPLLPAKRGYVEVIDENGEHVYRRIETEETRKVDTLESEKADKTEAQAVWESMAAAIQEGVESA